MSFAFVLRMFYKSEAAEERGTLGGGSNGQAKWQVLLPRCCIWVFSYFKKGQLNNNRTKSKPIQSRYQEPPMLYLYYLGSYHKGCLYCCFF